MICEICGKVERFCSKCRYTHCPQCGGNPSRHREDEEEKLKETQNEPEGSTLSNM